MDILVIGKKEFSKGYYYGELFWNSFMTFEDYKRQNPGADKASFEKTVPTNARDFKKFTEPLRNMGSIDYAMLPLDPRWYDYGMRTVDHYLDLTDIRYFSPMHLWQQWDYIAKYYEHRPEAADKMIAVNTKGLRIRQSIELNKPYFINLR